MLTILTYVITKKGNEFRVKLPAKRVICPRCGGDGVHVNPNVDGHGLTAEDFDQDPDFKDAYISGRYDVTCERCIGEKVILIVDYDRLTPKMFNRVMRAEDADARDEAWKRRGY